MASFGGGIGFGDAQREIGPCKAAQQLRCIGRKAQSLEDLVAHDRSGSRGAGQHSGTGQIADQFADLQIFGTEVMAPLADAVGLVDRDQGAVALTQERAETRESQPLGRGVNQLILPLADALHAAAQFVAFKGRCQVGRGDSALGKGLDLVVHQREQRRHHQGGAGEQGSGQLVGQAFATASGRDQEQTAGVE